MIDVKQILTILQNQFVNVMLRDTSFYSKYKIVLSNEQQFVKQEDRQPNTIYLVVRFSDATLNYGQAVLPLSIRAIAEQNNIECCQKLLLDFVQDFNLQEPLLTDAEGHTNVDLGNNFLRQIYTSPSVITNFGEIYSGFRSLFTVAGTFLIGENSNPIESIIVPDIIIDDTQTPPVLYELKFLKANLDYSAQLDSQAFYTTGNITKSIGQTATISLSIFCYVLDDDFYKKVTNVIFEKYTSEGAPDDVDTSFTFTLTLKNSTTYANQVFKLVNASFTQSVGELPQISMTFAK